jgi:hypothetical protein
MIQIILIIAGVYCLLAKSIKVTNRKILMKPQLVYLGIIVIAYSVLMGSIGDGLIVNLIYFVSLIGIVSLFAFRAKPSLSPENQGSGLKAEGVSSMRNLGILFICVLLLGAFFYVFLNKM